jgi:REP element-mobilizing transposase RayT
MSRRPTPKINQVAHLTMRCNNKRSFFNLERDFSGIVSWLNTLPLFFQISVHHALIMPNHIHLLVTAQSNNMGSAMSYFLTNLAKYLNFQRSRINHIFGGRYRPTVILDKKHLVNVIRYIYQNPVRAGIVRDVREYPFSSLSFYLGTKNCGMVLSPDSFTADFFNLGVQGFEHWARYLTNTLSESDVKQMRLSLSRSKYEFSQKQLFALTKKGSDLVL